MAQDDPLLLDLDRQLEAAREKHREWLAKLNDAEEEEVRSRLHVSDLEQRISARLDQLDATSKEHKP